MSQIEELIQNEWIEERGGLWSISIVIAAKPHQEHITNIENFHGVSVYSIRSITISQNLLNFKYLVVTMQSPASVRAMIQFLS